MSKNLDLLPKYLNLSSASTIAVLTLAALAAGYLSQGAQSSQPQASPKDDDGKESKDIAITPTETQEEPAQGLVIPRPEVADLALSPLPLPVKPASSQVRSTSPSPQVQVDRNLVRAAVARSLQEVRGTTAAPAAGTTTTPTAFSRTSADSLADSLNSSGLTKGFSDIDHHWSYVPVTQLAASGVFQGFPDGSFRPDETVTRAQFAHLVLEVFQPQGKVNVTEASLREPVVFQDVPSSHWAYAPVQAAYRQGIFPRSGDDRFQPDHALSRYQAWNGVVQSLAIDDPEVASELLTQWLRWLHQAEAQTGKRSTDAPGNISSGNVSSENINPDNVSSGNISSGNVSPESGRSTDSLGHGNQRITRAELAALLYLALQLPPATQESPDQVQTSVPDQSPILIAARMTEHNSDNGEDDFEDGSEALQLGLNSSSSNVPRLGASTPSRPWQGMNLSVPESFAPESFSPETLSPETLSFSSQAASSQASPSVTVSSSSVRTLALNQPTPQALSPENVRRGDRPLPSATSTPPTVINASEQDETYTLGPGDRVLIDLFGLPDYSQDYQVLVDGSLNLPRVGQVQVAGLTLKEAETRIFSLYAQFYQQPATSVILTQARPLKVAVAGEINRPGVYTVSLEESTQFPRVTDVVQKAGGIQANADLRQIRVRRPQADGSVQDIQVNLWELIQNGDLTQDITLRDGDRILIPQAQALSPGESLQLATANFSPDSIQVNVVGEVVSPGQITVVPNTPLNQALLAAGGFNPGQASREVTLIRLNPNGTVTERDIKVDLSQGISEENNPILRHNDVIVVDRSSLAQARNTAGSIFGTLFRILPFFAFF